MKKWISYFLLATSVFSLDFSTEIDATYQTDFSSNNTPVTLKLNGEHSTDNIYGQFEIKADSETEELELTKAYAETYKRNSTLTFGRQPISWGNAYIFNRLNNLTSINILNPNEKTATLDGIKLKHSIGNSRVEGIVFNVNDSSDNYALRYTTLIKNSELMLNYVKKEADLEVAGSESTNDFILDFKGDLGVGIWTQFSYSFDTHKNFYLLGIDYSLTLFDQTLYLLNENSYDSNKELLLNYFRYEYGFNEWTGIKGGLMIQEKNSILTTTVSHKLNDEIEINLSHIFTNLDEASSVGSKLKNTYSKNNLELQIKAVF